MNNPRVSFTFANQASQGARPRQEDHAALWQPEQWSDPASTYPLLAVLADGMGGHVSGQIASQIACDTFISSFAGNNEDIGPRMARALDAANLAIANDIAKAPDRQGMGCTLVAAFLDGDGLRWVSVGDSALLLYRDGELRRLNADHSHGALLDQQAAEGIISNEAAISDTRRRALRSALTGDRIPLQEIRAQAVELRVGDRIVVASDGLLSLDGNEIATLIDESDIVAPDQLADTLLASVTDKNVPRQDNTTLIVVGITEQDSASASRQPEPAPATAKPAQATSMKILGLKPTYFALVVVVIFLIGMFAF